MNPQNDERVFSVDPNDQPFGAEWDANQELGRGGVSLVYELSFADDGTPAAGKIFNPSTRFLDPSRLLPRFRAEQWFALRFCHPNILRGDPGEIGDGRPFIVMPSMLRSLKDEMRRPGFASTIRAFSDLAFGALRGLAFLHATDVIHRDIKPDNILMRRYRKDSNTSGWCLSDFGIARFLPSALTRQTHTGDLMGSRDYIAPEQRSDPSLASFAADVFSLGVVFYEYLTGCLPTGMPEPISSAASDFAWAAPTIESMMNPDSCSRPSAACALISLWGAYSSQQVPSAHAILLNDHPSFLRRIRDTLRRRIRGERVGYTADWWGGSLYELDDLLNYAASFLEVTRERRTTVIQPSPAGKQPCRLDAIEISGAEELLLSDTEELWDQLSRSLFAQIR